MRHTGDKTNGFSMLEVVLVIAITALIAGIAIPRLSRGATASKETTLRANLKLLRNAIEFYAAEHGGQYPPQNLVFSASLCCYTSEDRYTYSSQMDVTKGTVLGPYLRTIPPNPIGDKTRPTYVTKVDDAESTPPKFVNNGWWYNAATGDIRANCEDTEVDEQGVPYNTY